jgi:uncharacterized membrane protein YkoI
MFRPLPDARVWFTAAALLSVATGAAFAGDDVDHQEAHRLVQEGRILPLAAILNGVGQKVPGEVLEVELEFDDGAYVYELKILGRNGRVQEVEVDAPSGTILKIEDDD